MKSPTIKIDLRRFSTTDLIVLIIAATVCVSVLSTISVGIWRQMRIEVIERVYRLLEQMLALICGLMGGKALAKSDTNPNFSPVPTPDSSDASDSLPR